MKYEFDPAKNETNIAQHGVDMTSAELFELETALIGVDDREYGETRYVAIGSLNGRVHVMVYTWRGAVIRVIGLRKANEREQRKYEQA